MADLTPPQCRSCGSRLRFVRMLTGKAMPCNSDRWAGGHTPSCWLRQRTTEGKTHV